MEMRTSGMGASTVVGVPPNGEAFRFERRD